MAQQETKPPTNTTRNTTSSTGMPGPGPKAAAVATKLSDDDHVELADMLPTAPEQSPEDDIMQLARIGDVPGIEKLYDSGKFEPTYCDGEGITPLHVWCCNSLAATLLTRYSGRLSTTNMPCANSSYKLEQR